MLIKPPISTNKKDRKHLRGHKYLYQVNDLGHPYVKVEAISEDGKFIYHTHLGKENSPYTSCSSASSEWFRPLTKKELLEIVVQFDY